MPLLMEQKIDTQVDTFNSRHSPKYFALGKGVSAITLVAIIFRLMQKLLAHMSMRAAFIYDLLANNTSEVNPDKVSTDTHGTTKKPCNFNMFGYYFARYKQLDSEHREIYGFHKPEYYKDLIVKPTHQAKRQLLLRSGTTCRELLFL